MTNEEFDALTEEERREIKHALFDFFQTKLMEFQFEDEDDENSV